ncbi:cation diffusion facilitator family transporter [Bdellovibrionota bacterium FG-1]
MTHLDRQQRLRASLISIIAGLGILGLKYVAYAMTGSTALKSDAYESTVNVAAAVFALGAILFAEQPADEDHPYGHGKIENFSAAFEGGLITLASLLIAFEGIKSLMNPSELKSLDLGLAFNIGAGLLNGLLGAFLIRTGKRLRSRAIEADGHHVMSDFITSVALVIGVAVVWLTGWRWLDSVLAITMGGWLFYIGFKLVRESAAALLDVENPAILTALVTAANADRPAEIVALHGLRTLRSGRFTHVDVHVVVPEFLPVRQAHDLVEAYGAHVLRQAGIEGEFHSHVDPCMQELCAQCTMGACPIRHQEFRSRPLIGVDTAVLPDGYQVTF